MTLSGQDTAGSTDKGVQDRLLDAAEQLFCEHGFEGTSVRDIAAAAGCNIASINYYFGGKDKLYVEVWRRHLNLMRQERVTSIHEVMSRDGGRPCLKTCCGHTRTHLSHRWWGKTGASDLSDL